MDNFANIFSQQKKETLTEGVQITDKDTLSKVNESFNKIRDIAPRTFKIEKSGASIYCYGNDDSWFYTTEKHDPLPDLKSYQAVYNHGTKSWQIIDRTSK